MKTILYTSFLNEDIRPGYKLKIHSQCQAFSNLGLTTYLMIVTNSGLRLYKFSNGQEQIIENVNNERSRKSSERNIRDEFFLFKLYLKTLKKIALKLKPDYLYVRRIVPLTNMLIKTLKELKKEKITVLYEYPTYPWQDEMIVNKQYLFYFIDRIFYKRLLNVVDKLVVVGSKDVENDKIIEISNAISSKTIPMKVQNDFNSENINLLAVAHVSYFHGYDRIIKGLKNYYDCNEVGRPQVHLNIVGPVEKKLGLEQMVLDYDLNEFVHFLGYKSGDDLDELFNNSDIGVGCLGVHRKNITYLNSLKNREYAARGIPFVFSECDYVIEKEKPDFIHKFSPDDTPIEINEIIEFYNRKKSSNKDIRNFAIEHLSWESQQKIIMEKI